MSFGNFRHLNFHITKALYAFSGGHLYVFLRNCEQFCDTKVDATELALFCILNRWMFKFCVTA